MPLATNLKLSELDALIDDFSGADIETLCREAAMTALRENIRARKVSLEHFKEAREEMHPTITPEITKWYEDFGQKLKRRRIEEKSDDRLFV